MVDFNLSEVLNLRGSKISTTTFPCLF